MTLILHGGGGPGLLIASWTDFESVSMEIASASR